MKLASKYAVYFTHFLLYPYRPYVDVAYYNTGFGAARQQFTAFIVWIPLQIFAFLVYPAFKARLGKTYFAFFEENVPFL